MNKKNNKEKNFLQKYLKIIIAIILIVILITLSSIFMINSCSKLSFDTSLGVYKLGEIYDVPMAKTNKVRFVSQDERVLKVVNNELIPTSGGYSIITATKGNKTAKHTAIITNITHEEAGLTLNTKEAKVYYTTEPKTIGITIEITNVSSTAKTINANSNLSFSIGLKDSETKYESTYARLSSDITKTDNIVIKSSNSVEIVVFFNLTEIPNTFINSQNATMFNIYFHNLCVGANKISAWIYE